MSSVSAGRHEWIRHYPLREKAGLVVEVLGAYVSVKRRLRRVELHRLVEELRSPTAARSAYPTRLAEQAAAMRIGRAIGRIVTFVPGDSRCLVRSLVLMVVLARRGVASTLVIGVSPSPEFQAHAWVEVDDLAVLPSLEHIHQRIVEL